jgi:hypothetical protein
MSLELLFWILMLLWVIGYGYGVTRSPLAWPVIAPNLLLFVLLVILGWRVFGSAIK